MKSYNLLKQNWIPVLMTDGVNKKVSLHDILAGADQVVEIAAETPAVNLALLRLLIAISARSGAIVNDQFSPSKAKAYLKENENLFDLLDEKRPFMQIPAFETVNAEGEKADKPVSFLPFNRATGNNVVFLDHTVDETCAMPIDEFARWLVTKHAFVTSGGKLLTPEGKSPMSKGSSAISGASFIVMGTTLADTLALNPIQTTKSDLPVWERKLDRIGNSVVDEKRTPAGPVDALTSLSRAVRISSMSEDGIVNRIYMTHVPMSEFIDPFSIRIMDSTGKKEIPFSLRSNSLGNLPNSALEMLPEAVAKFPHAADSRAKELMVSGVAFKDASTFFNPCERISLIGCRKDEVSWALPIIKTFGKYFYGCAFGTKVKELTAQWEASFWILLLRDFNAGIPIKDALVPAARNASLCLIGRSPSFEHAVEKTLNPTVETTEQKPEKKKPEKKEKKTEDWKPQNEIIKKVGDKRNFDALFMCGKIASKGAKGFRLVGSAHEISSLTTSFRPKMTVAQKTMLSNILSSRKNRESKRKADVAESLVAKTICDIISKSKATDGNQRLMSALAECPNGEKIAQSLSKSRGPEEALKCLQAAVAMVKECRFSDLLVDVDDVLNGKCAETCYRLALEFVSSKKGV